MHAVTPPNIAGCREHVSPDGPPERPQVEHKRAIALAGWCFAGGLIDPYSPLLCAPLLALLQALLMQLPFLIETMLPRWCAECLTSLTLSITVSCWFRQ